MNGKSLASSGRLGLSLAAAAVVVLAVSAASAAASRSSTSTSDCSVVGHNVTPDSSLFAQLPASVKSSKSITIGVDPSAPPYDFRSPSGQLAGLEVQLGNLIGCVLGVKVNHKVLAFDGVLTGVQNGRLNMGMSTISDTTPREKVMNFVDYQTEGTAIVVQKGNPKHVSTLQSLCGLKVAGTSGSIPLQLVQLQSKKCSKPITVLSLPSGAAGYLAVSSGRADAFMDTFGTAKYMQAHKGSSGLGLEVKSVRLYAVGWQSIALPHNADGLQLTHAVANAVSKLISTRAYAALFNQWGLSIDMVKQPQINDAAKYSNFMSLKGQPTG